jgi:hypothetical protein
MRTLEDGDGSDKGAAPSAGDDEHVDSVAEAASQYNFAVDEATGAEAACMRWRLFFDRKRYNFRRAVAAPRIDASSDQAAVVAAMAAAAAAASAAGDDADAFLGADGVDLAHAMREEMARMPAPYTSMLPGNGSVDEGERASFSWAAMLCACLPAWATSDSRWWRVARSHLVRVCLERHPLLSVWFHHPADLFTSTHRITAAFVALFTTASVAALVYANFTHAIALVTAHSIALYACVALVLAVTHMITHSCCAAALAWYASLPRGTTAYWSPTRVAAVALLAAWTVAAALVAYAHAVQLDLRSGAGLATSVTSVHWARMCALAWLIDMVLLVPLAAAVRVYGTAAYARWKWQKRLFPEGALTLDADSNFSVVEIAALPRMITYGKPLMGVLDRNDAAAAAADCGDRGDSPSSYEPPSRASLYSVGIDGGNDRL